MVPFRYFTGIDVSKETLDLSVVKDNRELVHLKIANELKAIKKTLTQLARQYKDFDLTATLFCLEPTGIYNYPVWTVLASLKANVWLQAARQIQQSMGVQRGKTDRLDARLIARYAEVHQTQVQLWQPAREVLERLEALLRIRERMIGIRQQLKVPLQEMEARASKLVLKESKKLCQASLKAIESDIAQTEKAIQEVLQSDEELKRLMKLITSVDGIGPITACEIILTTAEFKQISDPKKFACYAGVAPFEHSSGKKLSRARASHMANKKVKRLLYMAAMSSIRSKSDLKNYYVRKVQEGKNKMLVLNAVRNKLIHRVFACVRDNRPYQDHYLTTLAI